MRTVRTLSNPPFGTRACWHLLVALLCRQKPSLNRLDTHDRYNENVRNTCLPSALSAQPRRKVRSKVRFLATVIKIPQDVQREPSLAIEITHGRSHNSPGIPLHRYLLAFWSRNLDDSVSNHHGLGGWGDCVDPRLAQRPI